MQNVSNQPTPTAEFKLPFIAEIFMALVTISASYLYFSNLFFVLVLLLVMAFLTIYRRNAWALGAAVLMTLAFDLYQSQRADEFRIVVLLLVVGVLVQLLSALWQRYQLGYWGSSFTENLIFAALGMIIAYAIQFAVCRPTITTFDTTGIFSIFLSLTGCVAEVGVEALDSMAGPMASQSDLPGALFVAYKAFGLLCLRIFYLSPAFWVIFMAGFRASGLAVWKPVRVLSYMARAGFGVVIISFLAGIAGLGVALVYNALDPVIDWPQFFIDEAQLLTIAFAASLFILLVGAAWGATDRSRNDLLITTL